MDKTKARSVEPIKYKNTQQNKIHYSHYCHIIFGEHLTIV